MITHDLALSEAYACLFVVEGAPEPVVRAAYRALARVLHPDRGGTAVEFQELEEALRTIERAGFPAGPAIARPPRARRLFAENHEADAVRCSCGRLTSLRPGSEVGRCAKCGRSVARKPSHQREFEEAWLAAANDVTMLLHRGTGLGPVTVAHLQHAAAVHRDLDARRERSPLQVQLATQSLRSLRLFRNGTHPGQLPRQPRCEGRPRTWWILIDEWRCERHGETECDRCGTSPIIEGAAG